MAVVPVRSKCPALCTFDTISQHPHTNFKGMWSIVHMYSTAAAAGSEILGQAASQTTHIRDSRISRTLIGQRLQHSTSPYPHSGDPLVCVTCVLLPPGDPPIIFLLITANDAVIRRGGRECSGPEFMILYDAILS